MLSRSRIPKILHTNYVTQYQNCELLTNLCRLLPRFQQTTWFFLWRCSKVYGSVVPSRVHAVVKWSCKLPLITPLKCCSYLPHVQCLKLAYTILILVQLKQSEASLAAAQAQITNLQEEVIMFFLQFLSNMSFLPNRSNTYETGRYHVFMLSQVY